MIDISSLFRLLGYFFFRQGVSHSQGYVPSSASSALAGLLGGGLAQAVASPADRVKAKKFDIEKNILDIIGLNT